MGWEAGSVRPMALAELGQHYRRYRLCDPSAEESMVVSLRRWGQLSPVVVCERDGVLELLDGFKRWSAAKLVGWTTLSARVLEVDDTTAKAAIYGLNLEGQRPSELEEAWIVHALVREDGVSQVQVAKLLGKHKSWVCRRLALLERLCVEAKADLRLGLLPPTLGRQLTRLPAGNQTAVLASARRASLTAAEVRGVIDLLQGATPEQEQSILEKPREALVEAAGVRDPARDPRLSPNGNWVARRLRHLLDALAALENWLQYPGPCELKRTDRILLVPRLEQLARDARHVAEQVDDLLLTQTLFGKKTLEATA